MAFSSSLKAEFAFASCIRFFNRIVVVPVPSSFCSRKCPTLMLTRSWQRPLTTTSYAFQQNHGQHRCLSACPRDNVDHSGNRLNITRADLSKQLEYPDAYTYNEDYDEDNLHMTPNSVTSQDREELDELEMARPECEALQYDYDLQAGVTEFGNCNCNYCSSSHDFEDAFESIQDDYVVLEEDWEISRTQQTGLNTAMGEAVLDVVDDDDC